MADAKFKVGDRVKVVAAPKTTGEVTKVMTPIRGAVYEVKLDVNKALTTYLEAQIARAQP
jgi:BMFP domain-containing protein YqiC